MTLYVTNLVFTREDPAYVIAKQGEKTSTEIAKKIPEIDLEGSPLEITYIKTAEDFISKACN